MPEGVHGNPVWAELAQLVPVITLAFPIVTGGAVDLARLGGAFSLATALAVVTTAAVARAGAVLNPIVVGTNLWLLMGAIAFGVGVPAMADLLSQYQGLVLFVAIGTTLIVSMGTPTGAIGARGPASWVRSRSLVLLAAAALAVTWSAWFHEDVRLGGGLPFIALNVLRRATIARGHSSAPSPSKVQ
jgi:hypothetical protein